MYSAQEIPIDRALPQMATAMNAAAMRELFQKRLFENSSNGSASTVEKERLQIRNCAIDHVRYKPGKSCTISYRLEIRDKRTDEIGDQRLCLRICERGDSLSRYMKAKTELLIAPPFGQPVMHVPDLDMVVWAFPNDRKLRSLPKLIDENFLRHGLLPKLIAGAFGQNWSLCDFSHQLVHYVPEHTCTVRVDMQVRNGQNGAGQSAAIFGKTYYNDEGAETFQNMLHLWNSEARRNGELQMAQPLRYDPEINTLWQMGLPGATLLEYDFGSSPFSELLMAAASCVAALHRTSLRCSRTISLDDIRAKLGEMPGLISRVRPECVNALQSLVNRLLEQSEHLGEQPVATLHGDLHLKNFFVQDENVALIDMDNLGNGSPLHDLGSFIAGMKYRGLMANIPGETIAKITRAFVQAYQARVPWIVSQNELNWHTAAALINERVFRSLTRLKSGSLDIVDRLIRLAPSRFI